MTGSSFCCSENEASLNLLREEYRRILRFVHPILLVLVYLFATFDSLNHFRGRNVDRLISCKYFFSVGTLADRLVVGWPTGHKKDHKILSFTGHTLITASRKLTCLSSLNIRNYYYLLLLFYL